MILRDIVRWKVLFVLCILILFSSIIVNIFSQTMAALVFSSIIVWLSLVPGLINPYLKEANMGDFVSVIMAVQVGGVAAAISGFLNVISGHFMGKLEIPLHTIKVAVCIFTLNLAVPLMYNLVGQNILFTMYLYSILFYILFSVQTLLFSPAEIVEDIKFAFIGLPMAFITNKLYLLMFGGMLDNMVKNGFRLSSGFLIITGIIVAVLLGVRYWVKQTTVPLKKIQTQSNIQKGISYPQSAQPVNYIPSVPSFNKKTTVDRLVNENLRLREYFQNK